MEINILADNMFTMWTNVSEFELIMTSHENIKKKHYGHTFERRVAQQIQLG